MRKTYEYPKSRAAYERACKLIPAGTGMKKDRNVNLESDARFEEEMAEKALASSRTYESDEEAEEQGEEDEELLDEEFEEEGLLEDSEEENAFIDENYFEE